MQVIEQTSRNVARPKRPERSGTVESPNPHEADARWQLAKRIASSRSFGRSKLLMEFLLYVVERDLSGFASEITEQQIGIAVFGREPGYDSNEDNIVRSYARNLRRRMEEYFAREGRHESVVLDIPRGGYAPIFTDRSAHKIREIEAPEETPNGSLPPQNDSTITEDIPEVALAEAIAVPLTDRQIAIADHRFNWRWLAYGVLLGLFLGLLFAFALHRWAAVDAFYPPSDSSALWYQIFRSDRDTFVVSSDDGLVIMQRLTDRPVPLSSYVSGDYRMKVSNSPDPSASELFKLGSRRYTSQADLDFVTHLAQLHEVVPARMFVRYARDLRMDDLRSGNAILIGSVEADPWIELFMSRMNFRQHVVAGDRKESGIVNVKPRPGEQAIYGTPNNDHTYGVIAYMPNLTGTGNVLLVGGLNTAGTQAVTNFLLTPSLMKGVLQRAKDARGQLRPFELLIGAGNVAANASTPEIVAERIGLDQ